MGEELRSLLKRHKLRSGRYQDRRAFHTKRGGHLRHGPSDTLAALTRRLGFADVIQIHALRHTYITHLIKAGNDLLTVQHLGAQRRQRGLTRGNTFGLNQFHSPAYKLIRAFSSILAFLDPQTNSWSSLRASPAFLMIFFSVPFLSSL